VRILAACDGSGAELDYDIASVLREHARGPLDDETEYLTSLLAHALAVLGRGCV
jgi:hypothetical protein